MPSQYNNRRAAGVSLEQVKLRKILPQEVERVQSHRVCRDASPLSATKLRVDRIHGIRPQLDSDSNP
jgi:hypothetical protein